MCLQFVFGSNKQNILFFFWLEQESEVTMVEALTKLANVYDVIVASLDPAAASAGVSPSSNSPRPQAGP